MRRVKGVLLKFFVKSIRANKSGIYDNLITEVDMQTVNKRILDAVWYPYEAFKNYFNAVCKVDAKDNVKIIQKWGYKRGKETSPVHFIPIICFLNDGLTLGNNMEKSFLIMKYI